MPDGDINPRAVIGGNLPPLAELLSTETADLDKRAADLVAGAGRAAVTDRESAEKATLLAGMIKTHLADIDTAREARKRPFLEAGRTVDAHFNGIAGKLATFDPKRKVIGGPLFSVLSMIDRFRREEEAKAAAERARLEAEARAAREQAAAAERAQREAEQREAEAARHAAEKVRQAEAEARRAGDRAAAEAAARARAEQARADAEASERRLAAEIEQKRQAEAAAELDRRAAAASVAPIDSGLGVKASGKKVTVVTIDDLGKAARHCVKVAEPEMRDLVQKVYDRLARAKVRDLPGATVREDTTTMIRSA